MQISAPQNSSSCHVTHCRNFSAMFFTFHDCIVCEYSENSSKNKKHLSLMCVVLTASDCNLCVSYINIDKASANT